MCARVRSDTRGDCVLHMAAGRHHRRQGTHAVVQMRRPTVRLHRQDLWSVRPAASGRETDGSVPERRQHPAYRLGLFRAAVRAQMAGFQNPELIGAARYCTSSVIRTSGLFASSKADISTFVTDCCPCRPICTKSKVL